LSTTFSIRLLPEPVSSTELVGKASWGLITIGSFQERFIASLDYWNAADYARHWKQAIRRIIQFSPSSCLITSMYDPVTANYVYWWTMYRINRTVFIQNQIFFLDKLSTPFNPNNPFTSIPERETVNEDGDEISEWSTTVEELEAFLQDRTA
jgi:hypothetical protein